MPAAIELADVSKRYDQGGPWAIEHASVEVAHGELIALVGESGSGKTTLLKMINRLLEPDAGVVRVHGRDVRSEDPVALRRTIGYVVQHAGLLPHLSVADNIAIVPQLLGWQRSQIDARIDELLDQVGLAPASYRGRFPDQLSGGQRQRVGVARALAARSKLLLLDEPLGALDPVTRVGLQGELARLHRALGLTTILVTHDMAEALRLADRVVVLRGGTIRQIATPTALLAAPADAETARLVDVVRKQAADLHALARSIPTPGDRSDASAPNVAERPSGAAGTDASAPRNDGPAPTIVAEERRGD